MSLKKIIILVVAFLFLALAGALLTLTGFYISLAGGIILFLLAILERKGKLSMPRTTGISLLIAITLLAVFVSSADFHSPESIIIQFFSALYIQLVLDNALIRIFFKKRIGGHYV